MATTSAKRTPVKTESTFKSAMSGEAWGGAAKGAVKGAAIGSIVPGVGTVAGGVIGGVIGGVKGMLSRRKKVKAAADAANLANAKLDQSNLELKRKAASVGSLLTFLEAHPEKYGKDLKADMFGWHPGPLTEDDYQNIAEPAPIGSSGLEDFLGQAAEGVDEYMGNRGAAQADVEGRISGGMDWGSTPVGGQLSKPDLSSIKFTGGVQQRQPVALFEKPKARTGLFGNG